MLNANSYMFRHQGAILRELKTTNDCKSCTTSAASRMRTVRCIETSGTNYPVTRRHIAEERIPHYGSPAI